MVLRRGFLSCIMNIFLSVLVIIIITVFGLYLLMKRKHTYWTRRGILQLKPEFLFGNFKEAVYERVIPNKIIVDAYHEFKNAGAKHGGIYFMYTPIWIPVDQNLIKQILYKDFWYFAGHGYFYQHKDDILSNHLFNAEGDEWKRLRSKLTPAFSSGKLKLMFDILARVGERLEKKVGDLCDEGEPINVKEVAACFGTDVIASCAFGLECNTLENPNNDFRKYGKMIFEPRFLAELVEQFFNWDVLNLFGHTWMKKDVNKFFLDLVRDMIDYREKNHITRYIGPFVKNVQNYRMAVKDINLAQIIFSTTVRKILTFPRFESGRVFARLKCYIRYAIVLERESFKSSDKFVLDVSYKGFNVSENINKLVTTYKAVKNLIFMKSQRLFYRGYIEAFVKKRPELPNDSERHKSCTNNFFYYRTQNTHFTHFLRFVKFVK